MTPALRSIPMQHLIPSGDPPETDWLWHGFVARMYATVLASHGRLGKTTLLNGLLQCLGHGRPFLDRAVKPVRALVISEEPISIWTARRRLLPVESNVELMARPFPRTVNLSDWNYLCQEVHRRVANEGIQLVVFDSLSSFLPSEDLMHRDKALRFAAPLFNLPFAGAGVLTLVNTRKEHEAVRLLIDQPLDPSNPFRLCFNLRQYGQYGTDSTWRRIVNRSNHPATPHSLSYRFCPMTGRFDVVNDPIDQRTRECRSTIVQILKQQAGPMSVDAILNEWPGPTRPLRQSIDEFLRGALYQKRLRREGKGVKGEPYRYWLANPEDDCE